jgi:fido (protein-threonine AMPylation protein)
VSPAAGPAPWREHPSDLPVIARNVAAIEAEILSTRGARDAFTLEIPREWHRRLFVGCQHMPPATYIGNFRGTALPGIASYAVRFGPFLGTPPGGVAAQLDGFEGQLQADLTRLDGAMPTESDVTKARLELLLPVAASAYAEWIRIHPFADGNGRTSRLLINWIMARYWQPLILPGRPPTDVDNLRAATAAAIAPGAADLRALRLNFRSRLVKARKAS